MNAAPERKLTTILAADAAGYSRLMEIDEAGTLAHLRACRELFTRLIAAHRGRVVGHAGDSLLAEFGSVVNAVECAVAIQRELHERNAALTEDRRMRFRIGVNLGDVLVEGGDLFGEGVNIAARLQALAEPGGILVSAPVFDQVKKKLALAFDYLGPQSVKNISEDVPAYRVLLDGSASSPLPFRERAAPGVSQRSGEGHPAPAPEGGSPGERFGSATLDDPPHPSAPQPPSFTTRGEGLPRPRPSKPERLARRATLAAILIALPFTINMLTWHGSTLWFQWPALAVLTLFGLRSVWVWWRS